MESIRFLREITCLLACQPRNLDCQVQSALECLCSTVGARAVGVFWPDAAGRLHPRGQHPGDFAVEGDLLPVIADINQPQAFVWSDARLNGLAAPMRVGGDTLGRLWALAAPDKPFDAAEQQFVVVAANQLALALENARLHDEVTRLAERRAELLRRVIAAQDERCRRTSRELHDEVSQSLTAMALDLEALQVAGGVDDRTLQRLGGLRSRVLSALDEVSRIILDLRPTLLEDMGLVSALRWYAAQKLGPIGVTLHVQASGVDDRLDPHLETTLYRIGQEALTNVGKHAQARNVWLTVQRVNAHLELSVRDDGCGFDVQQVLASPDTRVGIGLFGMKERAALTDGVFELRSTPGRGTRISVHIPVAASAAKVTDELYPGPVS